MKVIDSFSGDYAFLSNFYPADVWADFTVGNIVRCMLVRTVEHAYQAMKTVDEGSFFKICHANTPGKAKRYGKQVELRKDWESVKIQIMERLLRQKFFHDELATKLKATGDAELIEGNTWGDRFWGVCQGVGENHLGKLLMKIRREL